MKKRMLILFIDAIVLSLVLGFFTTTLVLEQYLISVVMLVILSVASAMYLYYRNAYLMS